MEAVHAGQPLQGREQIREELIWRDTQGPPSSGGPLSLLNLSEEMLDVKQASPEFLYYYKAHQ